MNKPWERVVSCLCGLEAGDRNGGPLRMAVILGNSLLKRGGFGPDAVFEAYREWWRSGAIDTGNVFKTVMEFADRGYSREDAAAKADEKLRRLTAGVNAAHRIAPLACFAPIPDSELDEIARKEAALTHRHPLAGDASAIMAVLLRGLIRGKSWEASRKQAVRMAREKETEEILGGDKLPYEENGFAPMILANALYFMDKGTDFVSTLEASVSHAGSANYSPVLVGAIAGARYGLLSMDSVGSQHGDSMAADVTSLAKNLALGWGLS